MVVASSPPLFNLFSFPDDGLKSFNVENLDNLGTVMASDSEIEDRRVIVERYVKGREKVRFSLFVVAIIMSVYVTHLDPRSN